MHYFLKYEGRGHFTLWRGAIISDAHLYYEKLNGWGEAGEEIWTLDKADSRLVMIPSIEWAANMLTEFEDELQEMDEGDWQ